MYAVICALFVNHALKIALFIVHFPKRAHIRTLNVKRAFLSYVQVLFTIKSSFQRFVEHNSTLFTPKTILFSLKRALFGPKTNPY